MIDWFDSGEADVILAVNNSAIALAVADLAVQRDRVFLATGQLPCDCGAHVHFMLMVRLDDGGRHGAAGRREIRDSLEYKGFERRS